MSGEEVVAILGNPHEHYLEKWWGELAILD